jgi:hypothetical protein
MKIFKFSFLMLLILAACGKTEAQKQEEQNKKVREMFHEIKPKGGNTGF